MKSPMVAMNGLSMVLLLLAGMLLLTTSTTYAAPHIPSYNPGYYSSGSLEGQNPEYILQTLARLRQALIAEEDLENVYKRAPLVMPDFGLRRDDSAKRLANYYLMMNKNNPSK